MIKCCPVLIVSQCSCLLLVSWTHSVTQTTTNLGSRKRIGHPDESDDPVLRDPVSPSRRWRFGEAPKQIPCELDRTMVAGQLDVTVPVLMNIEIHQKVLFLGMNALKEFGVSRNSVGRPVRASGKVERTRCVFGSFFSSFLFDPNFRFVLPSCLFSARWLALSSVSLRGRWLLIIEDDEHAVGACFPRLNVVVTFSTCQETLEAQRRYLQLRTVLLLSLILAFVSWNCCATVTDVSQMLWLSLFASVNAVFFSIIHTNISNTFNAQNYKESLCSGSRPGADCGNCWLSDVMVLETPDMWTVSERQYSWALMVSVLECSCSNPHPQCRCKGRRQRSLHAS